MRIGRFFSIILFIISLRREVQLNFIEFPNFRTLNRFTVQPLRWSNLQRRPCEPDRMSQELRRSRCLFWQRKSRGLKFFKWLIFQWQKQQKIISARLQLEITSCAKCNTGGDNSAVAKTWKERKTRSKIYRIFLMLYRVSLSEVSYEGRCFALIPESTDIVTNCLSSSNQNKNPLLWIKT